MKHLTKRLSASGVSELFDSVKKRTCAPQADDINRYRLGIDGVEETLSVLHLEGQKHLSQSWSFVVQFTAPHGLSMSQVLSKRVVIALMTGRESGLVNATLGTLSNTLGKVGGRVLSSVATRMTSDLSGFNARLGTEFGEEHQLYGVAMAFSQLSSSVDEARYEIAVYPRLQLLENTLGCAIYQNQTVPQIVEAVLRKHGLTGVDFRFELSESYPAKEYVTQWEESDLTFIRRLLADSGIWFWFESHSKNGCDVVVFGDSAQQYQDGPRAEYRTPSGHIDDGQEAVWDMSVTRRTVPNRVITQDYNYRTAQTRMKSEANERKKDTTTHGRRYLYAEHYRECGESVLSDSEQSDSIAPFGRDLDDFTTAAQEKELLPTGFSGSGSSLGSMTGWVTDSLDSAIDTITDSVSSAGRDIRHRADKVHSVVYQGVDLMAEASFSGEQRGEEELEPEEVGQGAWYAKLRHQRMMAEQVTIAGKTTLLHLAPGQILTVNGSSIAEAESGILIVSVTGAGDRAQAYQLAFTSIPYDVMCPYRPELLPWPSISGTLPARVTSPDSDQYGYMDSDGRYRVKMDFDLNDKWRRGEESLWIRRASVYAGDTYGLHFPLIDGTEVAIAFKRRLLWSE